MWCKYCKHVYVNGNMISVEVIPGMGKGRDEGERGGEFKCHTFNT
jgi:hypothetical protein